MLHENDPVEGAQFHLNGLVWILKMACYVLQTHVSAEIFHLKQQIWMFSPSCKIRSCVCTISSVGDANNGRGKTVVLTNL